MFAAEKGKLETVAYLIERSADIHAQNNVRIVLENLR
jgi:hypothetical protein